MRRERLEADIAEWRSLVATRCNVGEQAMDELESLLRDQVAALKAVGLADDEAFLIAVKRVESIDRPSEAFATEEGQLWKQLVGPEQVDQTGDDPGWTGGLVLGIAAAITLEIARLVADSDQASSSNWLPRNLAILVLPFLAAYFVRRRHLGTRSALLQIVAFAGAAVIVNAYPFRPEGATELLTVAHLPFALWAVVGVAYMGGAVRGQDRRMDFVRFSGEWAIYYVLIALGGGVLTALTAAILEPVLTSPDEATIWIVTAGAAGAVLVAAVLVEWKQGIVENMAPILTMIFTPLFAVMLAGAAATYAVTGFGEAFQREMLGTFDGLMAIVLGLVLYDLSARHAGTPPGWMDRIRLFAVISALVLDSVVLIALVARIGDLGFTANRVVALGLNVVLLINLVGTAVHYWRFIIRRGTFDRLLRWQTAYLPVFACWATVVVVIIPPIFAFD